MQLSGCTRFLKEVSCIWTGQSHAKRLNCRYVSCCLSLTRSPFQKSPELIAHLKKVEKELANKEYNAMVKDVMTRQEQDRYNLREFRDAGRQVTTIINILFSVIATFTA